MNDFSITLKRVSPAILTGLSISGVIGTAVSAVKATPKAMRLIKTKKDELKAEKLTTVELVQATWKCYIPSFFIGAGTILCIVGIGGMDKRNRAALTSAYAMLNESYKNYREAAKRVYGNDADDKIHAEIAKDANVYTGDFGFQVYNKSMDSDSESLLFYDLASKRYFNATMASVINAQYHVNRNLTLRGYCPLNEYLSFLGIEGEEHGDDIGWDISELIESMECYWLDFNNTKTTLEDGLECIMIDAPPLSALV